MGREARVKRDGFKGGEKKAPREIKVWSEQDIRNILTAKPKKAKPVVDIVLPDSGEHNTIPVNEDGRII